MRTSTLKHYIGLLAIILIAGSQSLHAQLVTNTTTLETFSSIQAAIDDANTLNGHTLTLAAGVYAENVLVNKEVSIIGPKAGVDGNDPSRGTGEAIVHPAVINYGDGVYWASGGKIFNITADNVTIDGFTIDGDNPLLVESSYMINGANIDCESGIASHGGYAGEDPDEAGDNLVIKNNVIKNLMGYGIIMWGAYTNTSSQSAQIIHNKFQNIFFMAIWLGENYYASVEYNTITDASIGVLLYWYWLSNTSTYPGTIKNNSITTKTMVRSDGAIASDNSGIQADFFYNGIADASWVVSDNILNHAPARSDKSKGIYVSRIEDQQSMTISNNIISNFQYGYVLHSTGMRYNWQTPQSLEISGGEVSNCSYGVIAANIYANDPNRTFFPGRVNGVTIINNETTGIYLTSENLFWEEPYIPNTVKLDIVNCKITGNPIGILNGGNLGFATIHNNDLSSNNSFAINNLSTNVIDATCNWYGHWTGPTNIANPGGMGTKVSNLVTFDPWHTSGDFDLITAGFQPKPGSCVPIKCGNNNKKYLFCHKGKTLCVGYDDALTHLAHGDPLGECVEAAITNASVIVPEASIPEALKVSNFPNPFVNSITIKYELPFDGKVSIKIFDLMGKEVASLVNSEKKAGVHSVDFNASRLGKGMYYYKLTATTKEKEYLQSGKMIKQ